MSTSSPTSPSWLRQRWRRHTTLRWLLPLLMVAAAAGAWQSLKPKAPPKPPATGEVKLGDITQVVQAAGILQAKTRVEVGAQVSGQIKTLHVQLGQQVKKGDLLVSLDPELANTEVARAEAAVLQQRAQLDGRRVDQAAALREAERQRRLLAGNATSALEAERAETDLAKIEADVRGQSAIMARLQADLSQAQTRLGYTRIVAPMDGTVVSLPVQVGQTVIAVQVPPVMMTLADLDTVTVRTRVSEADIQTVKVGQTAKFVTLSGETQRYEGKLRVIQPVPERSGNAVFYNALFEVDNRARKLYLDMTVGVDIETGQAKQVLTLPMVALGERDKEGLFRVMVLDADGKQKPRSVKVGLQDGKLAQVLDGLKVGERVVTAPTAAAKGGPSADDKDAKE